MNGNLFLDAESLYVELLKGVRSMLTPNTRLVGITSGGAWLAVRLHKDLGLEGEAGSISSAMHRDDFAQRGLADGGQTKLPFEINGAHLIVQGRRSTIDFWPGTGLWIDRDTNTTGRGVQKLITFIG